MQGVVFYTVSRDTDAHGNAMDIVAQFKRMLDPLMPTCAGMHSSSYDRHVLPPLPLWSRRSDSLVNLSGGFFCFCGGDGFMCLLARHPPQASQAGPNPPRPAAAGTGQVSLGSGVPITLAERARGVPKPLRAKIQPPPRTPRDGGGRVAA
jgi:hypothetical protein